MKKKKEEFYNDVEDQLKKPAWQKIIIGDFNGQIGPRADNSKYIGEFNGDIWTETGEFLADFAERNKLYITNTFFEKPEAKRWTYQSTNVNKTRHEIDFGLSSDRFMVKNVEVLNRLNTGSDHRPLRLTLNINIKTNKKKMNTKVGQNLNADLLQKAINNKEWSNNGNLTEKFEEIQSKLKICVEEATTGKKKKHSRLREETHLLLKKRSCMDRQTNPIEFIEISKLIRRKIQEDHDDFRLQKVLKVIEEKKSLKKCRKQLQQQTTMMKALKDEEGTRLTKRKDIKRRCKTFHTNLFETRREVSLEIDNKEEEIPEILTSEVQEAVRNLKKDTAPGPDGITNEALKAREHTLWKILARFFNECLKENIPEQWKTSTTVIIPKKGDREDLKKL